MDERPMRQSALFGVVALAILLSLPVELSAKPTADEGWRPLFNGKNLDGWYTFLEPKRGTDKSTGRNNDPEGIFKAEHGMIHVFGIPETTKMQPYGYVATHEEYSDVHIHVEYKWGTKRFGGFYSATGIELRNSGVIFLMTGPDDDARAVECQLEESNTGDMELWGTTAISQVRLPDFPVFDIDEPGRPVGKTKGNATRIIKEGAVENLYGWNSIDILLDGDRVTQLVNGRKVNGAWDIRQANPDNPSELIPLKRGHIALQEEGAEVWFRNLKVRPLLPSERYVDWRTRK